MVCGEVAVRRFSRRVKTVITREVPTATITISEVSIRSERDDINTISSLL